MPYYRWNLRDDLTAPEYARRRLRDGMRWMASIGVSPISTQNVGLTCVVGCGHSGTTLLASRIGKHPAVFAIPRETRAFMPEHGRLAGRASLLEWQSCALSKNANLVLEKTPKHVHATKTIFAVAPEASVLAVTRGPLDTIASLYKRTGDFDQSLRRWLTDNKALLAAATDNRVRIVRYEELTKFPGRTLTEVQEWLSLHPSPEVLEAGPTVYDSIRQSGNMEVRRQQVTSEIAPRTGAWRTSLSADQVNVVVERTAALADRLGLEPPGLATE